MKYPVSVWLDYFGDLPLYDAIGRLSKAGFTHGELSLDHLEQMMEGDPVTNGSELRKYADHCGFSIPQGHLSFEGGLCDDASLERLVPELDFFAAAGIGKAVLHANGGNDLSDEERYARRVFYVSKIAEYVEGTGITVCVENMYSDPMCRTAEHIKSIITDAGSKNLAICLDTGHLHLARERKLAKQTHREFILESGELLQALHITDNNGATDTHQMPFSARFGVNWHEVMGALNEIDYKGLFNLEILGERVAPMKIREAKLSFIRAMCEYMLSEPFLTEGYEYPPYDMR